MKALTLTQPWAQLVAIGAKKIETRSWRTDYTGPLAIHAAKGFPADARELASCRLVLDPMRPYFRDDIPMLKQYPLGAVVAICRLKACVPTEVLDPGDTVFSVSVQKLSDQEIQFGDFSRGRWGWLLEDIKMLPTPIPAKGALGLWEWRLDYFEGEEGIPGEPCICALQSSSICPKHGPVRRGARL